MAKKKEKYDLQEVVNHLYEEWKSSKIKEEIKNYLAGVAQDKGNAGEDYVLKQLNKFSEWNFTKTPESKTSADIVGMKENTETVYFFLIQVKTGSKQHIQKTHEETETLPILKDILLNYLSKEKRNVLVCTCFVLIEADNDNVTINKNNDISISRKKYYFLKNGATSGRISKINKVIDTCKQFKQRKSTEKN